MVFELNIDQISKFKAWAKKFEGMNPGSIGGAFTFSFTPTSVGMIVHVKHFSGEILDLSEYDGM